MGRREGCQLSVTEQADHADVADLAKFGYKQELRRALGVYSSFAIAFSYISPSTGIFTLFILGIGLAGPAFFWSWPIVVVGQLLVGLNFAEVSSHFPVAGSVYQWSKYLSNHTYSWFTGWIYLFDGTYLSAGPTAAGTFLGAMFMSLFVIYGFDTASTLAEETKNPRREAPRAVIAAIIGAAIIGAIFLFATVLAVPGSMGKFVSDTGAGKYPFPLLTIITANF